MILLNFSHPLTSEQLAQLGKLGRPGPAQVLDVKVQFDAATPYAEQIASLVSGIALSALEWQRAPILINPPALSFVAVALLAELHGRMGYFPPCLRLRPLAGSLPPQFEVAELLDLNAIREQARQRR